MIGRLCCVALCVSPAELSWTGGSSSSVFVAAAAAAAAPVSWADMRRLWILGASPRSASEHFFHVKLAAFRANNQLATLNPDS